MNNGSDGSPLDMWVQGGASALERGYNFLTFDGPGQGAALWLQHLYFRPDWEHVITPVVNFVSSRPDVDPHRIAVQGISQGGYWVPRAAAFEHRLAAIVADPGVLDVATSWNSHLPPPLLQLLHGGDKDTFDRYMTEGTPEQRGALAFRMRPYGLSTPFDVFTAVQQYTMNGLIDQIRCPTFVCNPADEQFWPGQPQQFYDQLTAPKQLVDFTVAQGANWHCEPMAPGLRSQRVYDWLDTTLGHSG
jgi:acetyl esterase/lipase